MNDWHVLIDREDYRNTSVVEATPTDLHDGQCRLAVDTFGLTANNVTYAAAGDLIGYWNFFPAPDTDGETTWGRTPVWGFADVVESCHDGLPEGERLYGYFPMSTELVIEPSRVNDHSVTDGSTHRSALPPVYNQYARCSGDPGYDPALEAEQMLYRPLFFTSFLIDDFLEDIAFGNTSTVILASASSKTAFGTAHLLAKRDGITIVGLTSAGNVDFVNSLGCYDQVLAYEDTAQLPDGSAVLVDMSGNPDVVRSVHERYGDALGFSSAVGLTHWEDRQAASGDPLPGPPQEFFFAPSRVEQRHKDWGPGGLETRLGAAWPGFVETVSGQVEIEHLHGAEAVQATWAELVEGAASPSRAQVLHTR